MYTCIALPTASTLCPRLPDSARSILHSQPARAASQSSLTLKQASARPPSYTSPSASACPANLAYSQQTTSNTHLTPYTSRLLFHRHPIAAGLATRPSVTSFFRLPRPHSGDQIDPQELERPANPLHPLLLTLPREPTRASLSDHPPWATARPRTPARTRTTLPAGAASPPLQA